MTPTAPDRPAATRCTLAGLAGRLGGTAAGDPGAILTGAAGLAEAGPGDVTFIESARLLPKAAAGRAGAVLLPPGLDLPGRNSIRMANPRLGFAAALELFYPRERPPAGVHPTAVVAADAAVDPTASVGALCFVGPGARIGARAVLHPQVHVGPRAAIGEDALLHAGAIVLERVVLGARAIVHAGAVIGGDGFGYVFDGRAHRKIPQVGTVEIGDDVEIGAGTTIDRGTTGATRIGSGTKIDNLVQIGHNSSVGENCCVVAQAGIAGSAEIGARCVLGGQAGISDHVKLGDGVRVGAQAGVNRDLASGDWVGSPAIPYDSGARVYAALEHFPDYRDRVRALEAKVARLSGNDVATGEPAVGPGERLREE